MMRPRGSRVTWCSRCRCVLLASALASMQRLSIEVTAQGERARCDNGRLVCATWAGAAPGHRGPSVGCHALESSLTSCPTTWVAFARRRGTCLRMWIVAGSRRCSVTGVATVQLSATGTGRSYLCPGVDGRVTRRTRRLHDDSDSRVHAAIVVAKLGFAIARVRAGLYGARSIAASPPVHRDEVVPRHGESKRRPQAPRERLDATIQSPRGGRLVELHVRDATDVGTMKTSAIGCVRRSGLEQAWE